jgi:hypothetical protein
MVRVLAFPATLILPFNLNLIPFTPMIEKIGVKKYLRTYFKYLKKSLYFQKLIFFIIFNNQCERKKGSRSLKDKYKISNDSAKNNRGPSIFLKTLNLGAQFKHWAFS